MRRMALVVFLLGFVILGCTKKFELTDGVCINMPMCASAYVAVLNSKIEQISDFWKCENYFYGYHYRKDQYEMFAVDLGNYNIYYGDDASQFVLKKELPINRWTNPPELFGELITNRNRRDLFLLNCKMEDRKRRR